MAKANIFNIEKKIIFTSALAGVAQWTEHMPANQRIITSIPNQGTCLGCVWARSPQWGALKRQPHIDVSLLLSLLLPLSNPKNRGHRGGFNLTLFRNKEIKSFFKKVVFVSS